VLDHVPMIVIQVNASCLICESRGGHDRDFRMGRRVAQGVSFRTPAYVPHGWQARTMDLSVGKIVAHCMDPHDLVLSKLVVGRDKDLEFASAAAALGSRCAIRVAGALPLRSARRSERRS
jgi:hypothetical protein